MFFKFISFNGFNRVILKFFNCVIFITKHVFNKEAFFKFWFKCSINYWIVQMLNLCMPSTFLKQCYTVIFYYTLYQYWQKSNLGYKAYCNLYISHSFGRNRWMDFSFIWKKIVIKIYLKFCFFKYVKWISFFSSLLFILFLPFSLLFYSFIF